ncbi:MAG TPA: hypothetical protein DEQ09_08620 [Bacteroidales bacterium]|nr:hypothetical protein [Bacteroidales bacterium]
MQKIYMPSTDMNPEILFSPDENIFRIKGISRPENVREIYEPAVKWLADFRKELTPENSSFSEESPFTLEINLEYFNSSSAKFLYDIIMLTRSIKEKEIPTAIIWMYDPADPDCREAGEDLAILAEMDFVYIKKQE